MPSLNIQLRETDIVKLVLEFLNNRSLNISMLSVERESGIINGCYSDDMLFLRQLILDGQWDDVIDFIQPLGTVDTFDMRSFKYAIFKHKYLELLCIKSEYGSGAVDPGTGDSELAVDEVVKCLNSLEDLCPSKEDYSNLCLLLTLPRLSDHADYQEWNPSNARVECFKIILPLVEKYLVIDKKHDNISPERLQTAHEDRLVQLCVKGLLYESCVEYCQQQATSSQYNSPDLTLSEVLNGTGFSDADISLLSWLQALPQTTFACPFEQRKVNLNLHALQKPSLEASWCEQILVTPIKPKMFPHSAVPSSRPRSADLMMTRSLQPQYDGLAHGLLTRDQHSKLQDPHSLLSRSFAGGFQLNALANSVTGAPQRRSHMLESVDRLFDESVTLDTQSSVIVQTPRGSPRLNTTSSDHGSSPRLKSASPHRKIERSESPLAKQSPNNKNDAQRKNDVSKSDVRKEDVMKSSVRDSSGDLYREYQKQRQLLQEQLEEQDRRRQEFQQQLQELDTKRMSLQDQDNRYIETSHDMDTNANRNMHPDNRVKNAWPEKDSGRMSSSQTPGRQSNQTPSNQTPVQQHHSNGVPHSNQHNNQHSNHLTAASPAKIVSTEFRKKNMK